MSEDAHGGNIGSELGSLQDDWKRLRSETVTSPAQGRQSRVPDNDWQVIVDGVTLGRSRDRQPKLTWVLVITTHGDFQGRKIWYDKKITKKSLKYVMRDLKLCGIDVPDISQLAAYLPAARGVELDISLKTEGEYRNVYFNHRLSDDHEMVGDEMLEDGPDGKDAPLN